MVFSQWRGWRFKQQPCTSHANKKTATVGGLVASVRSTSAQSAHALRSWQPSPNLSRVRPSSTRTTGPALTRWRCRHGFARATTATMPCGVVQRGDSRQAVQSLHSHADLLLTKKSPPAIALAAGKPSCGWQKPDGGIKGLPVYVRTFPLASAPGWLCAVL